MKMFSNKLISDEMTCEINLAGQAKLDGKTCQDINECNIDPSLCLGGICINTEGSFTCRCPNGNIYFTAWWFIAYFCKA
jgi:hypothetical protein